ncbi:MAG TPA: DNA primase, partial [Solirubrobacteraceae bacterium]|nr:DNA primase [Solirubrobacteraceae bacterium]
RYEGLCPFHEERTPSFGIDPVQKVYYCFGCQAAGDMFTFVRETEGVDFKGALELLADRAGIELEREREDPGEADRRRGRERLLELLARTAAYYERVLWESEEAARAREYLLGRGLTEQALREFQVGYSPSAWDRVLTASLRSGFSEAELYATGLAQRSQQNGRPYDRFRARIMFPLANIRGQVLGFGARALGESAPDGRRMPKYLNSAEGSLYHKGLHLYGAHLARPHAARAGNTILCEGYTDVIALHQAGLANAVGLMGTALTAEQVSELARMAPTVLLALDADSAGQEAMLRAAGLARRRKLELRVVPLPAGTDPAELVQREGATAIERAIASAQPFVRFRVERVLQAGDHASAEGRDRMLGELRPIFSMLGPSAMRMELTRLVAGRLDLPETLTETLLAPDGARAGANAAGTRTAAPARSQASGGRGGDGGSDRGRGGGALTRREETERAFLALCLASPEEGEAALAELDLDDYFTSDLSRRAARRLRGHLREPLRTGGGEGEGEEGSEEDSQLSALLAELIVQASAEPPNAALLPVQRLQLELAMIDRQIQLARSSDKAEVSALAQRRAEVKREFDGAYGRVLEETGERAG